MALFDFARNGDMCTVSYQLPGTFNRLTQPAPTNCPPGYLHLYEHMVIRANSSLLTRLQQEGSVYNGVTTANDVSFYLLSPANTEPSEAAELLKCHFDADDFALERRTVLEERRLTPEGDPRIDSLLGTAAQIAEFDLGILNDVRATLGPPLHIVYGTALARSGRHCEHDDADLSCASSDRSRLLAFFTHMTDVASPDSIDWSDSGTAREFIRENKANLLFRYELAITGLKRFDEEFGRYLRTVGLNIDLGEAFEEVPWEDLLPAA